MTGGRMPRTERQTNAAWLASHDRSAARTAAAAPLGLTDRERQLLGLPRRGKHLPMGPVTRAAIAAQHGEPDALLTVLLQCLAVILIAMAGMHLYARQHAPAATPQCAPGVVAAECRVEVRT